MFKGKSAVVDRVQAKFHAHVFNEDSLAGFHLVISDANYECIYALIFALNDGLRKDNSVVGMTGSIGDPEFLGGNCGRVNNKLLCRRFVCCGSLHFGRIVAVAKFGEAKAPHVFEAVYLFHERQMSFSV